MKYIVRVTLSSIVLIAISHGFAYAQNQPNTDVFTNAAEPGFELPSLSAQGNMGGGFDITPKPTSSMTPQQQSDFARSLVQKERCGPQDNGSYILCEPIPLINPVQKDPAALLRQLYVLALILAGSVAFIQIVRGGILYSISGVVDGKNRAKSIFMGVAQGLALLMGSYVILNTINPALVTLRFPDADNYFPPVPQQRETIYDEMEQMKTDFEDSGRILTRETQSQIDDLEYRRSNLNRTQTEIDRLSAISNRTDDEESKLRFAQESISRDKRALQVAEEEVLLLESSNPTQLLSQQVSRKERTLRFMEINLTDTKDTITELSALQTRTPDQQGELDLSKELLPQYQKEFNAAQDELLKIKQNVP